jgi:hypothetical protein
MSPVEFSHRQTALLKYWFVLVLFAEILMLILNTKLLVIYYIIALLFFGGFILRLLHLYPGKPEPLILDASAVILSLLFAYLSYSLGHSLFRFGLIFLSSLIILPHLIFIIKSPDL